MPDGYGDDPLYGDIGGGLPPDWAPDPNWAPPPHWGFDDAPPADVPQAAPVDVPAMPQLAPEQPSIPPPLPPPTPDAMPPEAPPVGQAIDAIPAEPDAVTGAGGMPAEGVIGATPYAATLTPEQHYAQTVQEFGEQPLDEQGNVRIPDKAEAQRYFSELRQRDPVKFATLQVQLGDIKTKRALAEQQRVANADWEQQQANAKMRAAAMEESKRKSDALVADAMRVANTKIDRTGGVSQVGAILMGVIGGLIQGKQGGRNIGLDALNDKINRGIEAQRAELAAQREGIGIRKGALAEEYARTGDEFHASEVTRLALLQRAHDQLSMEAQNYAPDGTTALKIADMQGAIVGQQQQAVRAYESEVFGKTLKVQEAARAQQLADETLRHNRAQEQQANAALYSAAQDRKAAADARAADKAAERADKEEERGRQYAVGLPLGRLELGADGKPAIGSDGKPVVKFGSLVNADGKEYRASSPEQHKALTDKIASGAERIEVYDRINALRERVGGESGAFNSDEFQELEQLGKDAAVLAKRGTQGMSSDADMENLAIMAGVKDVTSFRSQAAKLKSARARTVSSINKELRANKYTGPALEFPEPGAATKNTPAEDRTQGLLQKPAVTYDQAIAAELAARTHSWTPTSKEVVTPDGLSQRSPAYQQAYQDAKAAVDAVWDPGASPDQQAEIARLGSAAMGGDKVARGELEKIASSAHTAKLRELAKQALTPPVDPMLGGVSRVPPPPSGIDTLLQPDPALSGVSRQGWR